MQFKQSARFRPGAARSAFRLKRFAANRIQHSTFGCSVIYFAHGRRATTGKPHPIALRARVVAFVEEGNSNREAARHFQVSPRFINNMMILHRSTGSLAPARQDHPPGSKLAAHGVWISECVSGHGEVTLDELCRDLAGRGVDVHRVPVGRFRHRLGLTNKKKPQGKRTAQAGDRQGRVNRGSAVERGSSSSTRHRQTRN